VLSLVQFFYLFIFTDKALFLPFFEIPQFDNCQCSYSSVTTLINLFDMSGVFDILDAVLIEDSRGLYDSGNELMMIAEKSLLAINVSILVSVV
jgi:hypothetical protein